MALTTFAENGQLVFGLNSSYNSTELQDMVSNATTQGGATLYSQSLEHLHSLIVSPGPLGYRGGRVAVVIVTDGRNQEQLSLTSAAAARLRSVATVLFVGVGDLVAPELPETLASSQNLIFTANESSVLPSLAAVVAQKIECGLITYPTTTSTATTTTTTQSTTSTTQGQPATELPTSAKSVSCDGYQARQRIIFLLDASSSVPGNSWRSVIEYVKTQADNTGVRLAMP